MVLSYTLTHTFTAYLFKNFQTDISHELHSVIEFKFWEKDASGRQKVPYFPAHKTYRDFFVRNFRKK